MMIAELFALALAESMPDYDLPKICKGVEALGVINPAIAHQSCIRDENAARQNLLRVWTNIPASIRAKCIKEAQTFAPSYVEILACIEMEPQDYIGTYRLPEPTLNQPPLVGRSRPDRPAVNGNPSSQ
jgi:hypothetical protein